MRSCLEFDEGALLFVSGHSAGEIGADWRCQTCEHCSKEFCYWNVQEGYGEAFVPVYGGQSTKDAATREALGDLLFRLKHYGQLVRCAHCGKFQQAMIAQARRENASRALRTGFFWTCFPVFGFGIASIFVKPNDWVLLASFASGFLGGMFTVGAWLLAWWFDPNQGRYLLWRADKEMESKAITREAFDELMKSEAEQAGDNVPPVL